jgi:hypothetical protein
MAHVDLATAQVIAADAYSITGNSHARSTLTRASLLYFFRALEIAPARPSGFGRDEVERVEAAWEAIHGDWISCGYIVALRSGRRAYLQYDFGEHLREDDSVELVEQVDLLPIAAERAPRLQGGGIKWTDEVQHINDHLPGQP